MGSMTLPPQGPARPAAQPPTRVVVVVPRQEPGVHEYLQRALACIKDVEVVLDRRAAAVTPADDRRRGPAKNGERQLLICSLVHCPIELPAPPAPEASMRPQDSGQHRTLLWPDLGREHL
jgi:hypothetical protein